MRLDTAPQPEASIGLDYFGSAFKMEQQFYEKRSHDKFGMDVTVPRAEHRKLLHNIA
jgi:aspartate/glutamate racemase